MYVLQHLHAASCNRAEMYPRGHKERIQIELWLGLNMQKKYIEHSSLS